MLTIVVEQEGAVFAVDVQSLAAAPNVMDLSGALFAVDRK